MKKLLFLLFFISIILGNKAFAQDTLHTSSTQIALTILEKIDHEISLTAQQREGVLALLTDRSKQIEKFKAKEKPKKLSKKSLVNINLSAYNELKKILTEEQFALLQETREATKRQKEKYPEELVHLTEQDLELDF